MKKSLLSAFVIASLLAFNACKKEEGPVGPAGPQGERGPEGPKGVDGGQGVAGKDGTKIYNATSAPSGAKEGDYYFNPSTKMLFGPLTSGAWGSGTSLQGEAGVKGDKGDAGVSPHVDATTGNWFIGTTDTGVKAQGINGTDGDDGITPHIDATTGNWFIGTTDTGVKAQGEKGASFMAGTLAPGATAPAPNVGNVGDWFFDTDNSTFYGPKGASGWGTGNVLPLGRAFGARTYHIIRGFENVVETSKTYAQMLTEEYDDYALLSSYRVSVEDKRRFDNYSKWHENREMIFETVANSGIFNRVPRGAFDFAGSGVAVPTALAPGYAITVGDNFKYTNAPIEEAHHTYTLLQEDIDRLSVSNGNAFTYLTYAATKAEDVVVDGYLTFYQKKSLNLVQDPEKFHATYTAETNLDLNTIEPNLERWKKEGAYVFVGYNWYSDESTDNELIDSYSPGSRGYVNITDHVLTYVNEDVVYGQNGEFTTGAGYYIQSNQTGATSNIGASSSGSPFGFHPATTGANINGGANFGGRRINIDNTTPFDQYATPRTGAANANYSNGKLHIKWNINSGTAGTHTLNISPLTLTNPGNLTMENLLQNPTWVNRAQNREYYTPPRLDYGFNTTTYPIANSTTAYVWVPTGWFTGYWSTVTGATGIQNVRNNNGGQPASYFSSHKLFRVTLNVVPANIVALAQAAGVDVNNADALINFANSNLQLQ